MEINEESEEVVLNTCIKNRLLYITMSMVAGSKDMYN